MPDSFKHPADLPIAPLGNSDSVPTVGPFTAPDLNRAKLGKTIIQLDTIEQFLFLFFIQGPKNTNSILTLQAKTRMHKIVGQLT
jgi:hypothetical protein